MKIQNKKSGPGWIFIFTVLFSILPMKYEDKSTRVIDFFCHTIYN